LYLSRKCFTGLVLFQRRIILTGRKIAGQATFLLPPCPFFSYAVPFMPRIPRGQLAGHAYHILNRGNGGAIVFHKEADYAAFLALLPIAKTKFPVRVFGFCLMPNHFHLVLQPANADALSPFMQWWMTSHVRRYHRHYHSSGHVWQGRFKSFPIQQDEHFLTVLRYVVRNPVRAQLVASATQWSWSSLHHPTLVDPSPVPLPDEWLRWIDTPLFEHELTTLRTCLTRQSPFGSPEWQAQFADTAGLASTLRPRGRPRKTSNK
jgi:putative transposase